MDTIPKAMSDILIFFASSAVTPSESPSLSAPAKSTRFSFDSTVSLKFHCYNGD